MTRRRRLSHDPRTIQPKGGSAIHEPHPQPQPGQGLGPGPGRVLAFSHTGPRGTGPSLVEDVRWHWDWYTGTDHLTLCAVPSYVRTCITQLRTRTASQGQQPPIGHMLCCALYHGLEWIGQEPAVRQLITVRAQVESLRGVEVEDLEELAGWVRDFRVSIPNRMATRLDRTNVRVPPWLRSRLAYLSEELGTTNSSLAVLSILVALHGQAGLSEGFYTYLEEGISSFLRRVCLRVRIAQALLIEFGGGGKGGSRVG